LVFVAVDWTQPATAADKTDAHKTGKIEHRRTLGTVVADIAFPVFWTGLVETLIKPR
jgi:hypothetical protein